MAVLTISQCEISVPSGTMFLDTCVLIAAYCPADQYHGDAEDFLLQETPFLVPYVVLAEAWGLLVGSRKQLALGVRMIESLKSRPNVQFVPIPSGLLDQSHRLCDNYAIDLVDAFLICIASFSKRVLKLKKPIPIATYDTRDFCKCYNRLPFGCFDVRDRHLL